MADEYKIVADKIVSHEADVVVSVSGGLYINSISNNTKVATMADVGNGGGGSADIADFVFSVDEDGAPSRMTVTDHDMTIETVRDNDAVGSDCDINIQAADDVFIRAYGDEIGIYASSEVTIQTNSYDGSGTGEEGPVNGAPQEWTFRTDGKIEFPDGTLQTTGNIRPVADFLTWGEGTNHLPDLNTHFGWNSNGLWFQNAQSSEGPITSYPIFTDFTIPEDGSVIVEFIFDANTECSNIGVCVYSDGDNPEWNYGTDSSRIAAQFDCFDLKLYGRTTSAAGEVGIPESGLYRVRFAYDPTASTDKVTVSYTAQGSEEVIESLSINEALPAGPYRIGFAADQDSSSTKTYMTYMSINVDFNDEEYGSDNYGTDLDTGNSGSGTTGDITFDGVKIIGAGTASGDGNGYGTMELVPDATLNSDQYIIIDPTGPNHVHIRAGGEQDNSGAELILGAEKTNVKVSDYYGQVRISTSSENYTFTRTNEEIAESSTFSNNDSLDLYNVAEPGWVAINPAGDIAEITGTELVEDSRFEATVAEVNFFQPATSYTFRSGNTYDGDRSWVFGADGVLEGPAEGAVKVLAVTNAPGNTLTAASDSNVLITAINDVIIASETDGIYLAAAGGAYIGISSSTEDRIATLGDIGEDTSFTVVGGALGDAPTFTGDPLFTGSYVKTGPMVHFRIEVDMDNITSFGTGQYYLDLPFPSKYSYKFRDGCLHDISETISYSISGHVAAGESRMYLFSTDTQSGKVFDVAFMHNTPVALATADNFHIAGDYIWEPEAP